MVGDGRSYMLGPTGEAGIDAPKPKYARKAKIDDTRWKLRGVWDHKVWDHKDGIINNGSFINREEYDNKKIVFRILTSLSS